MRIELAVEACAGPDALHPLQLLLRAFSAERHEWAADEAAIIAWAKYFGIHVPTLAPIVRTLGQKAIVDAVWSSGQRGVPVQVTAANLSDFADDLSRAAVLVVEDLVADGAFIRAVATVFAHQRILTAIAKGWLELRHAGGTGRIPDVVAAERGGFLALSRIAVLADSDRLIPGQRTRIHHTTEAFPAVGVLVHVLALREAENYVPHRILAACGDPSAVSATLTALKRLTPDQRDHYDMKNGFGRRNVPPRIPPGQRDLYDNLDQRTRNALRGGFGDRLLPTFEEHSRSVTVRDIALLGSHVEADLRALLSTIESVI